MDTSYKHYKPSQYAASDTWEAAIGLQQVDGLTPSKYLYQLADSNINGKLTFDEIEELLYNYQKNNEHADTKEADIVSKRIAEILSEPAFSFRPTTMISIHQHLFQDLMPYAGKIRNLNLTKQEPILDYNTVRYTNYMDIQMNMQYDFENERKTDYSNFSREQIITHIAAFTRNVWQTHPFREGNTRTTAVFMKKYLNAIGFSVDNTLFAEKSQYFRNALVRANYADYSKGISETTAYLEKFYDNLLFHGQHELTNKELICFQLFEKSASLKDPISQMNTKSGNILSRSNLPESKNNECQ